MSRVAPIRVAEAQQAPGSDSETNRYVEPLALQSVVTLTRLLTRNKELRYEIKDEKGLILYYGVDEFGTFPRDYSRLDLSGETLQHICCLETIPNRRGKNLQVERCGRVLGDVSYHNPCLIRIQPAGSLTSFVVLKKVSKHLNLRFLPTGYYVYRAEPDNAKPVALISQRRSTSKGEDNSLAVRQLNFYDGQLTPLEKLIFISTAILITLPSRPLSYWQYLMQSMVGITSTTLESLKRLNLKLLSDAKSQIVKYEGVVTWKQAACV